MTKLNFALEKQYSVNKNKNAKFFTVLTLTIVHSTIILLV